MNYQVADFVIRIKNASLARRKKIVIPFSNLNREIGKALVKEGFLESVKEGMINGKKILETVVKYEKRRPVLTDVSIVSKPSLRVYTTGKNIKELERKGRHTIVLSTGNGILTGRDAYKKGIGGEVLFEIW